MGRRNLTAAATIVVCQLATVAWGQTAPTYSRDVAPILYERCVSCHRPGEVAPMSLMTYAEIRPWARSVKTKVQTREMPPWHAARAEGLPMRNDRSLSQDEIDTIVAWVDGGAVEGDPAYLPPAPTFREGWQHPSGRAPDLVVPMPIEYEIPADGMLEYVNFTNKVPLDEDAVLEAIEARPDNRTAVHHFAAGTGVFTETPPPGPSPAGIDALNIPYPSPTDENPRMPLGGGGGAGVVYVPGAGFDLYPEGHGTILRGGPDAYATFQMHYTMTGKPEKDRSSIGFWLRSDPIEKLVSGSTGAPATLLAEGREILWEPGRPAPLTYAKIPHIPPFAERFETKMIVPLVEATTIYSLNPHAHLRGKSWDYRVVYPDGREEVILVVPEYDFNWQLLYELEEPLHVPAGSKVVVTAVFDNSVKNRYNPAPHKEVVWADQSWEEMFVPFIEYVVDAEKTPGTSQD